MVQTNPKNLDKHKKETAIIILKFEHYDFTAACVPKV